jgi:hypothetical protein
MSYDVIVKLVRVILSHDDNFVKSHDLNFVRACCKIVYAPAAIEGIGTLSLPALHVGPISLKFLSDSHSSFVTPA